MEKVYRLLANRDLRRMILSDSFNGKINIDVSVKGSFKTVYSVDGLSKECFTNIFKLLIDLELLERRVGTNTASCPYCGSLDIRLENLYPRRGSIDIYKEYVVQHLKCGYIFLVENLNSNNCPRCGCDEGFRIVGGLFKCRDCKHTFEVQEFRYVGKVKF